MVQDSFMSAQGTPATNLRQGSHGFEVVGFVVGFGVVFLRWCFSCQFVQAEKSAEPSLDLRSLYSALVWSGNCANISVSFS